MLQYYDATKPMTLSVDSSKDGLGAEILQNDAPVAYASKSLTENQVHYAQIEKEASAILFECQRFHQYLYGRVVLVKTDDKPIEIIFKKPLEQCPLRIQRILINLQQYEIKVTYKPGSKLYFADALSRASYNDEKFDLHEKDIELHFCKIYSYITRKIRHFKTRNYER
ncbi:RNase H-like domain found in reverse transcriptase [Popillia japonica]|uniref:RNase H-like domain found in reverse transcriptase n=1 Tax=Popillia japonica TaxID=7064 RepID=A0AAW1KG18_POPJA